MKSQTLHAAFPDVSWAEVSRVAAQPAYRKAGVSIATFLYKQSVRQR
jgi:hypothetical protein